MTKTCCFFGHREVTHNIRGRLTAIIEKLITENGVTNFYVGHQGQFDNMAYSVLKELKSNYPHIRYSVVLAYMYTVTQYQSSRKSRCGMSASERSGCSSNR